MTRHLRQANTSESFVTDPHGSYFVGRSWLVFAVPDGDLSGVVLWGQPEDAYLDAALPVLARRIEQPAHASLVDTRMVTHVDPLVFDKLARFFTERRDAFGAAVTRAAILHGDGLVGAIAAGFTAAIQLPFPVRAFADPDAGLAWLVPSASESTIAAFDELVEIVAVARSTPPLVYQLARLIEADLALTVPQAADALGLSSRSFQRRLAELGTTFQAQLDATRVRLARRLLDHSDANVTRIAHAVGMRSAHALTALFERTVGRSPADLRSSARPA